MNHDEALKTLKQNTTCFYRGSLFFQALDYAIAQLEPKPTQFDERVAAYENEINNAKHRDDYPVHWELMPLIKDMQAHIQKLEKGQSDE